MIQNKHQLKKNQDLPKNVNIYRVGRNLVTDHAGGGGVVPTAKAINPTI